MDDRARIDAVLDQYAALRRIAERMAGDIARLRGITPHVVALEYGLLPAVDRDSI